MQHFGHPHSFQLTGLGLNQIQSPLNPHVPDPRHQANLEYYDSRMHAAGAQVMPPGQAPRGPNQQIASPFNPHVPDPRHQGNLEITGAQVMPPGQTPRGPMQHIEAPFNPHRVDPRYRPQVAGSQVMPSGQPPRGPNQQIASPFNPHVPDPRHQANLEYYDSRTHAAGAPVKLEYPRGEWRYQISGAGPLQSIVGAGPLQNIVGAGTDTSVLGSILNSQPMMLGLGLVIGFAAGVVLGPEVKKAFA